MKRHFWSVIVCAGFVATAAAQPPLDGQYGRPLGGPSEAGGPQQSNAMFSAIDADADGVITVRELRKAVAALKKLDLNKDGRITLAEVNSATDQPGAPAAGPNAAGRSGVQPGDPRPSGPDLMQYDRNHDGQLSPNEVPTQMMGLLRGADRNGNGTARSPRAATDPAANPRAVARPAAAATGPERRTAGLESHNAWSKYSITDLLGHADSGSPIPTGQ